MKLIDRYTRSYIIYAAMVLTVSIPVLYFSVQYLVARKTDQNLLRQKKLIVNSFSIRGNADQFTHAVFGEPGIKFKTAPVTAIAGDRFSTEFRTDTTDHDIEPWRILRTIVYIHDKPYLLELSSSLLDKEELIAGIVVIVVVTLLLIMVGLFAINRSLSALLWKPFYHTIGQLKKYSLEKDHILYFEKTRVEEFTELDSVIHALTHRNAAIFQSQKSFIENVSHEMQTPVAIQQAKLELLLQTEPLSEAQYRLIADLLDNTQRTGNLHDSLLLLAKIENRQYRDGESLSVQAIVANLAEEYAFQAALSNVALHVDGSTGPELQASKGLLIILLGNLLNNAIRHNTPGGSVHVSCSNSCIVFANTSNGTPLDTRNLFERFHQKPVLNDGAGLGLHIAKRIAGYYNLDLHYHFENNQHQFILNGFCRNSAGT